MPNWVTNYVVFKGKKERVNELLEKIREDDQPIGTFDFNKVIPMPESLDIISGGSTDRGIELFLTALNKDAPWFEVDWINKLDLNFDELLEKLNMEKVFIKHNPCLTFEEIERMRGYTSIDEALAVGYKASNNMLEYGATTWYEWNIKNWGCKWNASECYLETPNSISFSTAWSAPLPVLEALSKMFPDIVIEHKFADEDIGSNCGYATIKNGTAEGKFFEYGEESVRFACELWGWDAEEYLEDLEDCEED